MGAREATKEKDKLKTGGGFAGKFGGPEQKRAMYEAFKANDIRFDGRVFVGVSSTGVYCRPVCPARMPKYENCTFFASAAEAEAAGYRPCMLCRPELAPDMSISDATENLARRACAQGTIVLGLGYRPPYRFEALLNFFRVRALAGVEAVGENYYARTVRMPLGGEGGGEVFGWLRVENDEARSRLTLTMSETLLPVLSRVTARVRLQFDVDSDPAAVHEGLATLDAVVPGANVCGTRVPGCFDAFETAMRAVLGQQVSVAAANKLAARIVEAYGRPVETGVAGLSRVSPAPAEVLAMDSVEDAFGKLGVIKTRSRTIAEIARLLSAGELCLSSSAHAPEQIERLLAVKGIGPWSANYIAMRTLGYPDAFLETDAGIKHALPDYTPKKRLELAESWRPWRSYANICLWNSLA